MKFSIVLSILFFSTVIHAQPYDAAKQTIEQVLLNIQAFSYQIASVDDYVDYEGWDFVQNKLISFALSKMGLGFSVDYSDTVYNGEYTNWFKATYDYYVNNKKPHKEIKDALEKLRMQLLKKAQTINNSIIEQKNRAATRKNWLTTPR